MRTKKAAEPAWWAIRYGSYLDEDTDDSDFPGDQESDGSGSSSDSELAASGDEEVLAKVRAEKEKKVAQLAKARKANESRDAMQARAAKEASEAKKRQARAAEEREAEARAAEEARTAEEEEDRDPDEEEDQDPDEGRAAGENEEKCVCSLHVYMPSIDFAVSSRPEMLLTDEQVTVLHKRLPEFRAASPDARATIIQHAVGELERRWCNNSDFDRELVKTVCAISASGFPSHTFVDGSQIFV